MRRWRGGSFDARALALSGVVLGALLALPSSGPRAEERASPALQSIIAIEFKADDDLDSILMAAAPAGCTTWDAKQAAMNIVDAADAQLDEIARQNPSSAATTGRLNDPFIPKEVNSAKHELETRLGKILDLPICTPPPPPQQGLTNPHPDGPPPPPPPPPGGGGSDGPTSGEPPPGGDNPPPPPPPPVNPPKCEPVDPAEIAKLNADIQQTQQQLDTDKKKLEDTQKQIDADKAEIDGLEGNIDAAENLKPDANVGRPSSEQLQEWRDDIKSDRDELQQLEQELPLDQRNVDQDVTKLDSLMKALEALKKRSGCKDENQPGVQGPPQPEPQPHKDSLLEDILGHVTIGVGVGVGGGDDRHHDDRRDQPKTDAPRN